MLCLPSGIGLPYYVVLSLFPLLVAFAAALALMPLPNLFDQILALMTKFVPSDSMGLVRTVLKDAITPHGGSLLFCWNFGDNLGGLRTVNPPSTIKMAPLINEASSD